MHNNTLKSMHQSNIFARTFVLGLFLMIAGILGTTNNLQANPADLFSVDEQKIENAFAQINELESIVQANPDFQFSDLKSSEFASINGNIDANSLLHDSGDFEFDLNGFLWGLLCWPVGCFTVAFNDDKSQTEKQSYWIGLGVNVVLFGGSSILAWL